MAEFIINDFLSLKLVKDKTEIFINGKSFHQCKFLMMNLLIDEIENYDEIGSIDEAADALGWTYDGQEGVKYEIDPESEFWGHCSNLQAWYENDYDTRLLHSNLSFPLLKKLTEIGDPVAKRVLKKEIVERFISGYPTTMVYIFEEHLLDYLNGDEREQIISENFPMILKAIEKLPEKGEYSFLSNLIDETKGTGLIEENYLSFLGFIEKFLDAYIYDVYKYLLKLAQDKGLKKEHFLTFLESIKKLPDRDKCDAFSDILKISRLIMILKSRWMEDNFLVFLEIIEKIPHEAKYNAFHDLIRSIQGTELEKKFYSQIETQFLVLIEDIHKLGSQNNHTLFLWLLEIGNMTGLIKEHYPIFLRSIDMLKGEEKIIISTTIIIEIEGTEFENEIAFVEWKQKILGENKIRKVRLSIFIRFFQMIFVLVIVFAVVTILIRLSR